LKGKGEFMVLMLRKQEQKNGRNAQLRKTNYLIKSGRMKLVQKMSLKKFSKK